MTTQRTHDQKAAEPKFVTTNTGRILRVNADAVSAPVAPAPVVHPVDPARRADVLFRKRRDEGHELSSWWMIGAFLATSALVIVLLSGVPGVA